MKKIITAAALILMSGCASTYQPGSAGYVAQQQQPMVSQKAPAKNYSLSEVRAPMACAFEFVMVQNMWDKFQNPASDITREDMVEFARRDDAARRCLEKNTKDA